MGTRSNEEHPRDPKFNEIPPVAFDVAESYFNELNGDMLAETEKKFHDIKNEIGCNTIGNMVQLEDFLLASKYVGKTAMTDAMLKDIHKEIENKTLSDMAQLDAFLKLSKTRHSKAWTFQPKSAQWKDLAKYLRDDDATFCGEDMLLYKVRQELFEYGVRRDMTPDNMTGLLKLFFDKLESGVLKSTAIDKTFAKALHSEFFEADCKLKTLSDVEALIMKEYNTKVSLDLKVEIDLSNIKVFGKSAVEWKPSSADESTLEQLAKANCPGMVSTKTDPGFWFKLKLQQDFNDFHKQTG